MPFTFIRALVGNGGGDAIRQGGRKKRKIKQKNEKSRGPLTASPVPI